MRWSAYELSPCGPREECGVFGIFGHADAARLTYYGLCALQHRGQESAGIAVSDGTTLRCHKRMGLVSDVFTEEVLSVLNGASAVGHVRYSTTGSSMPANTQPLLTQLGRNQLALAHNGNLVNAYDLRSHLEERGVAFQTTVDTEVVAHLIAMAGVREVETAIAESLRTIRGSYSFVFLTEGKLIGARDVNGIRPLSIGRLGDA